MRARGLRREPRRRWSLFACSGLLATAASSCDATKSVTEQCSPVPSADLEPFATPASGTVNGENVNAVACPDGVSAWIEPAASTDLTPFLFTLIGTAGPGSASRRDFVFQKPQGAWGTALATLGLPTAVSGESSSRGGACGSVSFTYETPLSLDVDCDAGTDQGSTCPSGCARACPTSGCGDIPCEPDGTSATYQATDSTECGSTSRPPSGSWTLSLTSVMPDDAGADASASHFLVHGTLSATLIRAGGDSDTAAVSFTF
jgi:hypothetical protein